MCGIVGIVSSNEDVASDLVRGICRLEYRGYDSCGVAMPNGAALAVRKEIGGPKALADSGLFAELSGRAGLAHTRWATHGGVTQNNAHPHLTSDRSIAIVHNGVLHNYRELRAELSSAGYEFASETDSEIAAVLIEHHRKDGMDPRTAVLTAARRLEGTYALAVLFYDDLERLYALRKESPLVVGFGAGRAMLASDPMALGAECTEVLHPEDGDLLVLTHDTCEVFSIADGAPISRVRQPRDNDYEDPQLGEYEHFMAKEMAETGQAARAALGVDGAALERAVDTLRNARRVFLTGMGTAYHMALFGHYLLSHYAGLYAPVVTADELPDVVDFEPGDVVFGVSQSGETYDTLRALRKAKAAGASTLAICNVATSSMAREVDQVLLQGAGPEIAVLATKSATSQAVLLARLAITLARGAGRATNEELAGTERELAALPGLLEECGPEVDQSAREAAARFLGLEKWFFLGRGVYAAVGMEGALKFKEVTYRHAEGMAAGFLKHGTISLIDTDMGTAMFVPPRCTGDLRELTLTALEEVRSRGGPVLAIGHLDERERELVEATIPTPGEGLLGDAFLQLLAGQYLAYHTARALGRDVDRPRALAKSVTVP